MTMPGPGTAMHVASVDYAVTFAELSAVALPAKFSAPGAVHFNFTFDTGSTQTSPSSWDITWDYSWFNQPEIEASIAGTLDEVCASVGALLGLSMPQVQASVTVRRLWTLNQNSYSVVPGVSSGPQQVVLPDVMEYPHAVSDTDAVVAADAGESITAS